jgi:hypothetical protein
MTYRERREAKAERLRGWADTREERAADVLESNRVFTSDIAFNTQPGHIPLRARVIRQNDRAIESTIKADRMRSRADGIESQLAGAIYSDDPDAIEALEARITDLETKRERIKAHNREMRKPAACDHPADCDCRSHFPRDCSCKNHPLPSYVLQNLNGNLTRQRQRLEQLKRAEKVREAPVQSETDRDDGGTLVVTASREEIHYPGKPSAEVRSAIKAQGYRWDRVGSCWWRRLQPVGHAPDIDLVNGY